MPKKKVRRPPKPSPPRQRSIDVVHKPGMADEMLRELAPLLAEEGIDLTRGDFDIETLQAALNRAAERRNLALFTPVGRARRLAVAVVESAVTFLLANEPHEALAALDLAVPESPDGSQAEVSSCIGVALGIVDEIIAGRNTSAPPNLYRRLKKRPIYGPGDVAALDILAAARNGGSFHALRELIIAHGGREIHYASANALGMVIEAWSRATQTPIADLIRTHIS